MNAHRGSHSGTFSIGAAAKTTKLWDARGCMASQRGSRSEASVWAAPEASGGGLLANQSLSVPLGAFGHGSLKNPTHAKTLTLSGKRFKRVNLPAVRDKVFPKALSFRRQQCP